MTNTVREFLEGNLEDAKMELKETEGYSDRLEIEERIAWLEGELSK